MTGGHLAVEKSKHDELTSLEKGLLVVSEVAVAEGGVTMGRLAEVTGLNRTTMYRLCDALERSGWIQQIDTGAGRAGRRVGVGPTLLGLSICISSKYDLEARVMPIITNLANQVHEAVHAAVVRASEILHIARAAPDSGMHLAATIGEREYAHVTALGKAILATQTRAELTATYPEEALSVRTEYSIASRTLLFDDLDQVAQRGYAIDSQESRLGVMCVGAPVFDASGRAAFAISVTTTSARLEGGRMEEIASAVCEAAATATVALGGDHERGWERRNADEELRSGAIAAAAS